MNTDLLRGMDKTLEYFRGNYNGWTNNHLENFVAIALAGKDGTTHPELAKKFSRPNSTNTLTVKKMVEVYGLIDSTEDPTERRRFRLTLSSKGEKAMQKIEAFFNKQH